MYINYIKNAYQILPGNFKKKSIPFLLLSLVNLLLDLFSLAMVIPLIFIIVGSGEQGFAAVFENYFNDLAAGNNPLLISAIIILLIIIFVVKNNLSIKIINFQVSTCFHLASVISSSFLRNYMFYDFPAFKQKAQSDIIRDSIEIPNEFIVYILIAINTVISEIILLSLILGVGLFINPFVTGSLCFVLILAVFFTQRIGREKIKQINNSLARDYSGNISNLLNLMHGFFEIKTASREEYFLERFSSSNRAVNQKYATLYARNLITPKYSEVVIIVIIGSVIVLYNYLPQSDVSGLLYISFLAAAAMKVIPSINKIINAFINFRSHLFTVDIIREKISFIPDSADTTYESLVFNKNLQLSNITFSYTEKPLLQNIHLTVKKGEIVTIIGDSGVGKSTLLHIILQLIKPAEGFIRLDGHNITAQNSKAFLSFFAYVPQDPFILEGTVLENITLGNDSYDKNYLDELLADFGMDNVADQLPQKMETFIGNNGHALSGGQKQRLALIRALLFKPEILILDEACSQLQNDLEKKVLVKLQQKAGQFNMTVILVSHHVENISAICDHLYRLDIKGLEKLQSV